MTTSSASFVQDRPAGIAPIAIAAALLVAVGIVGFVFIRSPMLTPLWPSLLGTQVALYGLCWLALSAAVWCAAHVLRIAFAAALVATALVLVFVAAGIAASSVVAFVVFDAMLIGALVQRPDPDDASIATLASTGLAVMALVSNVAEFFPVNTRLTFAAVTLAIPLLLLDARVRACMQAFLARGASALRPQESNPRRCPTEIATAALTGVLGLHLIFALMPERYYDALAVHLYVPSYVLAHGRWSFDVGNWAFAHMPLSVDFLYTWLYALGGVDAVRLYNFAALALIACLILAWLNPRGTSIAAPLAALLFVATPLTFIATASLFIENTLTLWITAAAALAARRWAYMTPPVARTICVLLAAAVAAKLHGVIAAALIAGVTLAALVRARPSRHQWFGVVAAAAASAAFALVPYVYSWVDTGNPVFPFFNQIFKAYYWPRAAFVDERWIGHFDWRLLWNATFHSSAFIEGYDGALGLSLLALLPVAAVFVLWRGSAADRLALLVGLGLVVIIASQTQYLRYILVAMPILFVAIGWLIEAAIRYPLSGSVAVGAAALGVASSLYLIPSASWVLGASDVRAAFSQTAREQMIREQAPEQIANRFINATYGPEARVFYVENPFAALLEGTGLGSTWYNRRHATALAGVKTTEDVGAMLSDMGITHVVSAPGAPSPLRTATAAFVEKNGHLRASIGSLQVYEIEWP